MKKPILLSIVILLFIVSCSKKEELNTFKEGSLIKNELDIALSELLTESSGGIGKSFFLLPESTKFSQIPQDPKNPLTIEKVELGKLLFHETALSVNSKLKPFKHTYSCATCHHHQAGFQSGKAQGISEGGVGFGIIGNAREKDAMCPEDSLDIQPIHTPTVINSAYQKVMLWNGQFGATGPNIGTEALWAPGTPLETNFLGYEGIESQAIAGLSVHRMGLTTKLIYSTEYKKLFDLAFPDVPKNERYSILTAGLAIAAYERIVLANEAPFQKYLRGNTNALTDVQKKGAILFFGKAACVACHTGPALNSMDFYAYGMNDLGGPGIYGNEPDIATKKGRGGFTGIESDNCKFKVPQLYSLSQAKFYGHGSSFTSLMDVVIYKNYAIKENSFVPDSHLADEFVPLGLSKSEITFLSAFIENGLNDTELERYEPYSIPSGQCFPNNDEQSKIDLGCILP